MIEFRMPSLGADMEAGTLIEWKKKTGDAVKRGDCIAEVETQKGLIEIEVFDEGIIDEILIPEGTKVPVGTIMAMIKPSSVSLETKPTTLQPTEEKITEPILIENIEEKSIKASPLARRIASDNHIDISKIKGTGEDGVITKDDVEQVIRQQKPTETARTIPSTESIRAAVAAAMSKSNKEIPHYYLEKKINVTQALLWLKEQNKERKVTSRLLPVVLFIKATAKTLTGFPDLNAVWENGLQPKKSINIGFVVSLRTGGIIVPAISNANLKSIDEIMETLNDIIPRARALKLRSSELSDSTITLTSLGEDGADSVLV